VIRVLTAYNERFFLAKDCHVTYLDPVTISLFGRTPTAQTLCAGRVNVWPSLPSCHIKTTLSSPQDTKPFPPGITAILEK